VRFLLVVCEIFCEKRGDEKLNQIIYDTIDKMMKDEVERLKSLLTDDKYRDIDKQIKAKLPKLDPDGKGRVRYYFWQCNYDYDTQDENKVKVVDITGDEWKGYKIRQVGELNAIYSILIFHWNDGDGHGGIVGLQCHGVTCFNDPVYTHEAQGRLGTSSYKNTGWTKSPRNGARYLPHWGDKPLSDFKFPYLSFELIFFGKPTKTADHDFNIDDYRKLIMKADKEESTIDRDAVRSAMMDGMTILQARQKYPEIYRDDYKYIAGLRGDFLVHQPPPEWRINILLVGGSRLGKSAMTEVLLREFYKLLNPNADISKLHNDEMFLYAGEDKVDYQNYDGQPGIGHEETRSVDLVCDKGRAKILKLVDLYPKKYAANIKHASTNLIHHLNVFNTIENPIDFLNNLAGEYTDKKGNFHKSELPHKIQVYDRFRIIIDVGQTHYKILLNNGFYGNGDSLTYTEIKGVIGSMRTIFDPMGNRRKMSVEQERKAQAMMVAPIMYYVQKLIDSATVREPLTEDEFDATFGDYGQIDDDFYGHEYDGCDSYPGEGVDDDSDQIDHDFYGYEYGDYDDFDDDFDDNINHQYSIYYYGLLRDCDTFIII